MLQDFARLVLRQSIPDGDLLGYFESGYTQGIEKTAQACNVRTGLALGHDHCTGTLTCPCVGKADNGDFRNFRMADEDVLYLLRRDILSVANDDVLGPSGDN